MKFCSCGTRLGQGADVLLRVGPVLRCLRAPLGVNSPYLVGVEHDRPDGQELYNASVHGPDEIRNGAESWVGGALVVT